MEKIWQIINKIIDKVPSFLIGRLLIVIIVVPLVSILIAVILGQEVKVQVKKDTFFEIVKSDNLPPSDLSGMANEKFKITKVKSDLKNKSLQIMGVGNQEAPQLKAIVTKNGDRNTLCDGVKPQRFDKKYWLFYEKYWLFDCQLTSEGTYTIYVKASNGKGTKPIDISVKASQK